MITNNSKETQKLGKNLATELKDGMVLALYGELGSGKTTFVQGLARGLGIERRIISPTFIIVRKYQISNIKFPIYNLYHIDLYRIENENAVQGLGLVEIINDRRNIVAVEWAEKIKNLLPKKRIDIFFKNLGENKREITFKKYE